MNRLVKNVLFLFCMVQSFYILYLLNNLYHKSSFINVAVSDLRHKNEQLLNLKLSILTLKGDQLGVHLDTINYLKKTFSRVLKDEYFWAYEAYLAQKQVREMVHQAFPNLPKYDNSCFHGMWIHSILLDAPSNCIFFGTSGYSMARLNSTDYEKYSLFLNGEKIPFTPERVVQIPQQRYSKLQMVRTFVNLETGELEEQVDEREINFGAIEEN